MKMASLVMGVAAVLLSAPMVSVGVVSMFTTGALDSHSLKKSERVLVTITHVNPPKHFYISFMDDELGLESDHVYVSKHFNGWNRLGVGETIAVTRNSVVNRRGWLVEKLSMHKWPLFGRCFFSDSEIGRTEYKYADVRKGVEEVLR